MTYQSGTSALICSRKTIDTHKWFSSKFKQAEQKQTEIIKNNIINNNKYILLLIVNISFIYTGDLYIFIFQIIVIFILCNCKAYKKNIEMYNKIEPTVYMRISRLGIFYKDTHYIFSGTKKELQLEFNKLCYEDTLTKNEKYFGRGDHDHVTDTPLDIYYYKDDEENYISNWNFYNYNSLEDLKDCVVALNERYEKYPMYHEYIYLSKKCITLTTAK